MRPNQILLPDYTSFNEATKLAYRIEGYWKRMGKKVNARVVTQGGPVTHRSFVWCVRSDLTNGLPK